MQYSSNSPLIDFSSELMGTLETQVREACKNHPRPIAAFDADGTLWDTDIGEAFFDYQIHNCGLKGLPLDPWDFYHSTKLTDIHKAYVWLAAINTGQRLDQVRDWAMQAVQKNSPVPVFSSQKKLITLLQSLNFEIYVVTASVKWAVEPAAHLYNIPVENVLGIETLIRDGLVTDTAVEPITYREGKAAALLKATGGMRPILTAGNTTGDTALLESASHVRLAVCTQNQDSELFQSEQALQKIARTKGWLTHSFRAL